MKDSTKYTIYSLLSLLVGNTSPDGAKPIFYCLAIASIILAAICLFADSKDKS